MRERLTISFVIVTLLLIGLTGAISVHTLDGSLREQASEEVVHDAGVTARLLSDRGSSGGTIDEALLRALTDDRDRLEVAFNNGEVLGSTGSEFVADESVSATQPFESGTFTFRTSPQTSRQAWGEGFLGVLSLLILLGVAAGSVGFLLARYLAAPFRQLATAASALGRGRFDLELPASGIPEARAISRALESSADHLRDRIGREQQFATHASHELRTLLTRLRFDLEELNVIDHTGDSVQRVAATALQSVDDLNQVVGELVEISRRGSLVAGAEIPLRDLALQSAQRWSDRLAAEKRFVSAAADGEIDLLLTPGPVEQVLDLLLTDVVRHGTGDVRLVFRGDATSVRVEMTCVYAPVVTNKEQELGTQARSAVERLGGRFETHCDEHRVTVLLPRR